MKHLSEDAKKIIEKSDYPNQLKEIITFTEELLADLEIQPTELQWTILINHLNEMINRSNRQELLESIDISLFSDISQESISTAKKIAEKIGQMPEEEAYVLSIHFESAKQN